MISTQTGPKPADFADVRTTNLAVVLRYIRTNAPCSRADIASSTGLNKATVSSLVTELMDRRLVRETGLAEQRIGRPATLLVLDGSPYAAVGVAMDRDSLTAVATDLAGERLLSWRRALPHRDTAPGNAIAAVTAIAKRAATRLSRDGRQVLGLTVAVPGMVDPAGKVRLAPSLGWRDVDLADRLRRAMNRPGYPVTVDNDANLAALAEQRHAGLAGVANLVHLTCGTGVGAGIISDGRLLRGCGGFAGEIGHVVIDPLGPLCVCGRRGCLEVVAGIAALVRRLPPADDSPAAPAAQPGPGPDLDVDLESEVEDVARRARAGDAAVLAALDSAGRALGCGVHILANVVNPEVVVLGGYFARLAPWLLPAVEAELAVRMLAPDAGFRVHASTLDHTAAALGAAAHVLDTVDSGQVKTLRAG